MRPRQLVSLAMLCGTVALTDWGAARLGAFGASGIENTPTPIGDGSATRSAASLSDAPFAGAMASVAAVAGSLRPLEPAVGPAAMPVGKAAATADPNPPETAGASAAEGPVFETPLPASGPESPPETRLQLASIPTSDPLQQHPTPVVRAVETPDECLVAEICIDEYLWSLYERTPKTDTDKVTDRIKETVKTKGKIRTIMKTITKYVAADFTWKDPIAAQRAGMSLKDYVIGGLDRGFKVKLYRALRAIVSVKGENRLQRFAASEELWKWVDAHEKELGIGRPYLDRDPPHVGPIDGKEYSDKRGRTSVQKAGLSTNNAPAVAANTISRVNRASLKKEPGKLH
jgi:hypothetical protein